MVKLYTNEEREKKRIKFAQKREAGHSIAASCEASRISPSTYYSWNKEDGWTKVNGWTKDNGWTK